MRATLGQGPCLTMSPHSSCLSQGMAHGSCSANLFWTDDIRGGLTHHGPLGKSLFPSAGWTGSPKCPWTSQLEQTLLTQPVLGVWPLAVLKWFVGIALPFRGSWAVPTSGLRTCCFAGAGGTPGPAPGSREGALTWCRAPAPRTRKIGTKSKIPTMA